METGDKVDVLISVVVPSLNQGKYIREAIESVFAQRGDFAVELIVMDGGSIDGTLSLLKKIESDFKQGRYKTNPASSFSWTSRRDKGQTDAINKGLKKASGDFLCYLNADDYFEAGAFEKVVRGFKDNSKKLWLTGFSRVVNQRGEQIHRMITSYKNFWLKKYSFKTLQVLNYISQPATFLRREAIKRAGYLNEDLHYVMDYDYWLRLGKISNPVIIKDFLVNFRVHAQSKGGSQFDRQFREDLRVAAKYCDNSFLFLLHKIHNWLVTVVYKIIKRSWLTGADW